MARGRRKVHGMPRGFVSKKQMRYFFANPKLRTKYARKEAHKAGMHSSITKRLGFSPAYRRLPLRKGLRKRA
jgi:hypothetical protein